MNSDSEKAKKARDLFLSKRFGILSTHSVDVPGYPFGSVVPYAPDRAGYPIILISTLAQHTKNILRDPKVSLTVIEDGGADVQAKGRLTVLADAARIDPAAESAAERYYRSFPESRDYHKTHDFSFYRLTPVRVRFIGGFGDIYWVAAADFIRKNPFTAAEESMILSHMNKDHAPALGHYVRFFLKKENIADSAVEMTAIDAEGFDVRAGGEVLRIPFGEPVASVAEARGALVAMAKR